MTDAGSLQVGDEIRARVAKGAVACDGDGDGYGKRQDMSSSRRRRQTHIFLIEMTAWAVIILIAVVNAYANSPSAGVRVAA